MGLSVAARCWRRVLPRGVAQPCASLSDGREAEGGGGGWIAARTDHYNSSMRGFVVGVVVTLVVLAGTVFAISRFGLYPIGADNSPSPLERALAGRAMDVYA